MTTYPQQETVNFTTTTVYVAMANTGEEINSHSFLALAEALRTVASQKEQLRNAMASLVEKMQRSISHLDVGWTVNSLGEVQSSGPDVDRRCALFDASIQEYVRTRYLIVRTGAMTEDAVVAFETAAGWNGMNASRFDLDRKIARMNAGLAPEDVVREQAIQTGVARRDATYLERWEEFEATYEPRVLSTLERLHQELVERDRRPDAPVCEICGEGWEEGEEPVELLDAMPGEPEIAHVDCLIDRRNDRAGRSS